MITVIICGEAPRSVIFANILSHRLSIAPYSEIPQSVFFNIIHQVPYPNKVKKNYSYVKMLFLASFKFQNSRQILKSAM